MESPEIYIKFLTAFESSNKGYLKEQNIQGIMDICPEVINK